MPDIESNATALSTASATADVAAPQMDRADEAKAEIEQKSFEGKASGDGAKKLNEDSNKIPKSDVSSQSSQGKGPTKEPSDEADDKCDDSKDSKTAVANKSSKKKALKEEDDVEEDEQHKNSQKGSKSKSSAKEEKTNVTKKEKPSDSSSKSKKRKANSDEESDAKDKETDEEESETPKKKSRKKAQEEEKKEEEEGDEEEEDDDDDDEEELKPGLLEQPVVLEEGLKREKKKVLRLEITSPTPSKDKKLDIPEGSGEKLGDIPRVEFQLGKTLSDDLRPLHRLLFQRAGSASEVKRNIRRFSGFTFPKNSTEQKKKTDQLNKMTTSALKSVCEVLDLERGGRKEDIVERILNFLMKPKSSGKALPKPKKRRSSAGEKSKSKKSKSSKKTAQKKNSSKKSEPESSEEEEDESNEEEEDKEDKEEEEDEEDEEQESSEDESARKKKSNKATPAKKATSSKKADKKKTPKSEEKKTKGAAKNDKVKKSSASKKRSRDSESGESSDEEPLKRQKTEPTDDELKDIIKKILEGANLEEVTMKTVYKQVFEKYPDFDLSPRKDFIKAAVKQIIR